jgi:hypothetical protein
MEWFRSSTRTIAGEKDGSPPLGRKCRRISYNGIMADTLSKVEHTATETRSVSQIIYDEVASGKLTLSPLGQKLLEARRRIEESGIPLLNDEELEQEKAERRGGVENRDR